MINMPFQPGRKSCVEFIIIASDHRLSFLALKHSPGVSSSSQTASEER